MRSPWYCPDAFPNIRPPDQPATQAWTGRFPVSTMHRRFSTVPEWHTGARSRFRLNLQADRASGLRNNRTVFPDTRLRENFSAGPSMSCVHFFRNMTGPQPQGTAAGHRHHFHGRSAHQHDWSGKDFRYRKNNYIQIISNNYTKTFYEFIKPQDRGNQVQLITTPPHRRPAEYRQSLFSSGAIQLLLPGRFATYSGKSSPDIEGLIFIWTSVPFISQFKQQRILCNSLTIIIISLFFYQNCGNPFAYSGWALSCSPLRFFFFPPV